MIRVTSISNTESDGNIVKISAFADTKEEVVSGAKFVGLDDDAVIDMGSSIITAAGDLAFMKSDGTWSWVSSGGGGGSVLIPKTITQNGSYDPTDDNADGYSAVTVNVQGSSGGDVFYDCGEYFGLDEGLLASSLTITTEEHVGKKAVLIVMHRDDITITLQNWNLVGKYANPTDETHTIAQFISVYERIITNATEISTISQNTSARICACLFYLSPSASLVYDSSIGMDATSNVFKYNIPKKEQYTLCVMNNVYAGTAKTEIDPEIIVNCKSSMDTSNATRRMLAFINPSLTDVILQTNSTTKEDPLLCNRLYIFKISVPEDPVVLIEKTITDNGTYDASDDNADGYSSVIVNVSGGGDSDAFAEYDFTKLSGTYRNVQYGLNGAVFSTTNGCIGLMTPKVNDITIEVDIASMQLTSGTHRRLLMPTNADGFIYRSTGVWALYSGNWYESQETDGAFLDNCKLSVYIDSSNLWHLYKNGTLFFEPAAALALTTGAYGLSYGAIMLGSYDGNTINAATIRGVKIYDGEHIS